MKRFIFSTVVSIFFVNTVFSQDPDHVEGGLFSKSTEYNGLVRGNPEGTIIGQYNVGNKSPLEKIFFGLTNSPVEYVIETSFEGCAGLRLYKIPLVSFDWTLEIIPFGNYTEDVKEIIYKTEKIDIPPRYLGRLQQDYRNEVIEHNRNALILAADSQTYEPYRPDAMTFCVHHLGDRLYESMIDLIDRFTAEGIPPTSGGGVKVTLRCVVGDELWTLAIHEPQRKALQMSNLCRQMIEDARDGSFDEWKYVRMLEPIEF